MSVLSLLQLRITGQLRTIRVLETQLADTQYSLKVSAQQAAQSEVIVLKSAIIFTAIMIANLLPLVVMQIILTDGS